jgi:GNAT superfamily N-acetyltransferase
MAQLAKPATLWREEITYEDLSRLERLATAGGFSRPQEAALAAGLPGQHLREGADSSYRFVLAQRDEDIMACACYGPIAGTLHSWSLYWFMVAPQARNQGLGAELLARVVRRVAAAGGEMLYAEASSQPAHHLIRRFYQSRGYTLLTVLEDFYARGDGKVIYAKNLPEQALAQAPAGGRSAARSAAILAR